MKILFVRPKPSDETIGLQHLMIVEPLDLEVLASLVGSDDTPIIFDMILEKKSIEYFINIENPDILCITGYITNVSTMIHYCRIAKKVNSKIVTIVGGVHCEVCSYDFDNEFIDYRVVRNATTVFPQLLNFVKKIGDFPTCVLKQNDEIAQSDLPPFNYYFPLPNRELTKRYREEYFYIFHNRVALIKTSFGCPFSCNFCFCREITQHNYHERPIDEVIVELKIIKETNIYIVDDDFLTSRARVENFIEANKKANLNKHYLIYGRADFIANNPDLIERFGAIGLKTVIVGIESFFDDELIQFNKNIDSKTNEKAMQVLRRLGIECYATIIISPEWGKKEFEYSKDKIRELGIHFVNLQPLTPLPGTGQVVNPDDLLIPYSDYAKWDLAHVTIRPKRMSVADFYKSIIKLYNSILFQPRFLIGYILKNNFKMLWKMAIGSIRVSKQYSRKIREAKRDV